MAAEGVDKLDVDYDVEVGEAAERTMPPKLESIDYELVVDTDEDDRRLALLHENVKKYSTVINTVAPGTALRGSIRRGG